MAYNSSRFVCDFFVKLHLRKVKYDDKVNALNIHISSISSHPYLLSFNTPIMMYDKGRFYLTRVRYSVTTKKHQTYAYEALILNKINPKRIVFIEEEIYKYEDRKRRKKQHLA